jgi:acyl-coenzyme A synthetase/AMP-(fatty) acid ligase
LARRDGYGDLARADDEGYIYIVDRAEDFLKPWGHRVSSAEVEEAVLGMRDVTAAAVVGRPDRDAGEAVVVFCEVADTSSAGPDEILRHCRGALPKHMVPQEVHVVQGMPLNAHGKVIKAELRRRALAAAAETVVSRGGR